MEWERELVAGFVVNRFRGRESLLKDAVDYTERYTGKPIFGVVPYLRELGLPEEDSVSFKDAVTRGHKERSDIIEIAVIDLPHISNFTDFDALKNEPDVDVRIVQSPRDLGQPDAIVVPGSKNVIGDLAFLRHIGLDQAIVQKAANTEIVGICGGYQMLGMEIADTMAVESSGISTPGLGLLPLSTKMAVEKTLMRASGTHAASALPVHGYEIHHGQSEIAGLQPVVLRSDGMTIGAGRGHVWGTYLHGIFDADMFRRWFLDRLRERRGLSPLGKVYAPYDLEPAFERLAAMVRKSLRLDEIYRLMGLR
jgi:cobyric acid synthase CobQ